MGNVYLKELLLHILKFLPQVFYVGPEALYFHYSPLFQGLITMSHHLQTLCHFI